MLRLGARIESHYEVMAGVMCRLQFLCGFGEEESSPIGHAADNAVLLEDNAAGGFCDSIGGYVSDHRAGAGVFVGEEYSLTSERRPGRTCES